MSFSTALVSRGRERSQSLVDYLGSSLTILLPQPPIDHVDNFDGWMVLVVDKKSMRAISAAIGMYDIMERKVTLVEDIEKKRAPFKDMGAIYLLAPTEDSVNRLIADFEKPLYGNTCFVFFLGRIPEKQIEKIKQCRPLVKRLKALSEANVDFLAKELRAFHFDMRRAFNDVYVRRGRSKIEYRMAEKLISICSTLNEYPHIRYANESPTAQALAKTLDVKLNQFLKNDDFWFHGDANHSGRERATLLILDRKDDCLTPLMHDFTYQSMVMDLLDVRDDKITLDQENPQAEDDYMDEDYDSDEDDDDEDERKEPEPSPQRSKNAKDILLNENDAVWVELRGKHIAQVINTLSDRCREMVNSDTSGFSNKEKGETMSLTQMANALKALPEYREVMEKLSEHMQIAHKCMDRLNTSGLLELSELEQTLATGQTEEGAKPKLEDIMGQVTKQLKTLKDARSRFRLLMLTIVSQGGIKAEFKSALWSAAQVSKDQEKLLEVIQDSLDIPIANMGGDGGKFKTLFG
jgi:syntaxin-binding protein 1